MLLSLQAGPRADAAPSFITKLGYSAGNWGKSVVWTSFESFMLFYLVSIADLSPLVAGGLLAAAMAWDAIVDVGIAWWADRHGRAHVLGRLILFGAPLCGLGFWAIFALQAPLAVGLAIVLCRIGYSLCDIGHNTLLVRVARTEADASTVSGLRLIFSALGAGLVASMSGWSLAIGDRAGQHSAFATGALVGGLLYIGTLFGSVAVTRHLPPVRTDGGGPRPGRFAALWRHRTYRRVLTLAFIQAGMVPLFIRALPFFGQMVHGQASWAGPALVTITLAQSLSLPGWIALSRWRGPPVLGAIAHGVLIAAIIGLGIRSDGVAGSLMLVLLGCAQAGMNMALWALLTMAIRGSIQGGSAAEALPVGLFLAALKGAAGAAHFGFTLIVAATGPQCGGCADGTGTLLPMSAILVPALGSILCIALLVRWPSRADA
ncbi:MFS transporter [Sphingomonadaceae bacterium jetA1]|jgi:Na+/melibiose symporter-like transporter|uniref:MFS transporter n=1 Tax=Facivitalis istanbulensis TaxID=3075838 RepID=UPI0034833DDC